MREPGGRNEQRVPDWFKKAQEKAKKPRNADKPVQRSRFASALDAADSESAGSFAEASKPSDHERRMYPIPVATILLMCQAPNGT